jgi:GTP-binding protein
MAFRREKFVPRGGPSGGDGGPGGSVYLVANANLNTLLNYRFQKIFEAGRGGHGEGSNRTGKNGQDIDLEVPAGTSVFEKREDGEFVLVADLTESGQRVLIAKGGLGGHGNASFATSTNRAPRKTQPGLPGEEKDLRLHLKLLADVGLVGFPNAGKSTMIARISAARPKIADYPFTTLVPNLGVVGLSGDRSFVVADVPGLIEGAHAGHGLGHRFLSHLERTKVLVHLVDVSSATGRDPVSDYDAIVRELELFPRGAEREEGVPASDVSGERLADKPVIAVANKIDALDDPDRLERLRAHVEKLGVPFHAASGATGEGMDALLEAIWREVAAARDRAAAEPRTALRDPQDGPEPGRGTAEPRTAEPRTANREPRSVSE